MKRKKLVIIGAGGMGREALAQILESRQESRRYDILGFVDNAPAPGGAGSNMVDGFPIVGDDSWLLNYTDEIAVVIALGNPHARKQAYEKFAGKTNISFPAVVADEVKRSPSVTIGRGCIIGPYSVMTVDVRIRDFVIVLRQCGIGHDVVLDDFVTLYPGVTVSGNVSIGARAEIGTGTSIIQNKSIGENSVVGAGSVVVRNIPANCTAVGVPAKVIKMIPPPHAITAWFIRLQAPSRRRGIYAEWRCL